MKLDKLCILFTDGDWIESKDQSDSGIRLIQTGNIGNGEFLYKNDKAKYISVDTFKRLNCKEVFPNDILVSRLPEPVGRGCIIPDIGEKMITAVDCTICRINENLVDRKYFCYFLESNAYKTQLEQHVTGTTRKRISRKNLSSVEIDIPEQAKQKEVVYKLDRLKKIIQNYNRELDLLDELVRARFVEMFGDPVINSCQFPVQPMTDICDIIDGDRGKNYPKSEEILDDGYCLFLNAKNVTQKGFDFENCNFITREKDDALRNGKLSRGDVVLTTRGTVGNLAYYSKNVPYENIRINSGMVILRMNRSILNEIYFIELFKMKLSDIKEKIASGSAQPQLPISTMNKIILMIPPLELQNQFASFVKEIDKSGSNCFIQQS
mgnify:CR=1 FL=1